MAQEVNGVAERRMVTLVVPVYNEADIFVASLTGLHEYMTSLSDRWDWELVVIDDGSTDLTGSLADTFAATRDNVRVHHQRTNLRLGQGVRDGVALSRGDYVVTFDCDLSYAPDHIGRLLDTIDETGADIVIASPYMRGGATRKIPFSRRVMSRWANRFLSMTAQGRISTITGLVRAYDGRFIRDLDLKAVDVDVNIEIVYKAQILRARIVEIPAVLDWTFIRAHRGRQRLSARLVWNTLKSLVSGFLFRPFMFFFLPGVVLTGIAVAAGLADRHWLAALTLLLGIQLLSLGFITLQAKRYFEELFHLGTTVHARLRAPDEDALRDG
ncbi:MAG: dolichol-phosphate mannosyltransferase [Frankiaceae bacterium]|jgi:glycosyltransferase involved in cell wall biosynthesis|nr:dolichol-phosphate mannosyltransferase [Frankiaceae bacterium]